ncbi:septation ring formation regulator EzrA [Lacticigenium naphthae]|uniref:septation ring formation regulator EzrA n=1 Tax=Lacticigenium naphthae TaxID=515351 RepID=UPI00041D841F|nr:septation ring formation regulator EzrA [Lacticigenium naphthae]
MNQELLFIGIMGLLIVIYFIIKQLKNKHYAVIDSLDEKKSQLFEHTIDQQVLSIEDLQITGESEKKFLSLKEDWKRIETVLLSQIENSLYEAEKCVDQYRLKKASRLEKEIKDNIEMVKKNLEEVDSDLQAVLKDHENNLKEVKETKNRYETIRKNLLTNSFAYGEALEGLEDQLTVIEKKFNSFYDATEARDYVGAKNIITSIHNLLDEMNVYLSELPELVNLQEEIFPTDVDDLENAYGKIQQKGCEVADFDLKKIKNELIKDLNDLETEIKTLNLNNANRLSEKIDTKLETYFSIIETEFRAKDKVIEKQTQLRQAFHYFEKRLHQIELEFDRLEQNYVLDKQMKTELTDLYEEIAIEKETYQSIEDQLADQTIIYSLINDRLDSLMTSLETIHKKITKLNENLLNLRTRELAIKEDLKMMETKMRELKRKIEMHHLPGLSAEYLEYFFYVTDHIESLKKEIGQLKIDMKSIGKSYQFLKEDMKDLEEKTEILIESALLTEQYMQYIRRYQESNETVEEVMEKSYILFTEEYEYTRAATLLEEKLEEIESDSVKRIKEEFLAKA